METIQARAYDGPWTPPVWPEARGLSDSDLRTRVNIDMPAIRTDDGLALLARKQVGKGVAVFCQLDPDALPADSKTYLRLTRWRHTRALSQLLANLGATRQSDAGFLQPGERCKPIALSGQWRAMQTTQLPSSKAPAKAHKDPGISKKAKSAVAADVDDSGWQTLTVPGEFGPFKNTDGEAVFRRTVILPAEWTGRPLTLSLGAIDDFDTVYVNGQAVGSTGVDTEGFWAFPRRYTVPAGLMKSGKNVIAVRVFDRFGDGGMKGGGHGLLLMPAGSNGNRPALYHPDYLTDFKFGDDPYRFFRW
jgi:hypothetical protein